MKSLSLEKIKDKINPNYSISRTNTFLKDQPTTFSTEASKVYLLPPLKRDIFKRSLIQQSSVLSKYISNFVSNYIRNSQDLMNFNSEPNTNKFSKRRSINSNEIKNIQKDNKINKEEEDSIKNNQNDIDNDDEKGSLSERGQIQNIKKRNMNNFDRKLLYITEIKNKQNGISPQISFIKNKNPKKVNKNILQKKIVPNIKVIIPSGDETNLPKSINIEQELSFADYKKLQKLFRRKKTYQPNILSNWKERIGLDIKTSKKNYISEVENDVEYQSKILTDQTKLLEGNIKYFNRHIVSNPNFKNAFNSLSLKSKIDFNKTLEETIGIIYLLPQLILLDFYEIINRFDSIKIPNNQKFSDKYVFDEFENLIYNCNLLMEVSDFFHNCFDVYLILINEVDQMNINFNNFSNIISSFEKARYNMIYVINSSKNAIKYYDKDMKFINKFNNKMGLKKQISKPKFITNKIMNQFFFKKNPERQKKIMIDSCLSENKRDDEQLDINIYDYFHKKGKTPKFKSLVNTKLVKNLLKSCTENVKNLINTEIINNQMSGNNSEDDEILPNKRKVIKIHL